MLETLGLSAVCMEVKRRNQLKQNTSRSVQAEMERSLLDNMGEDQHG